MSNKALAPTHNFPISFLPNPRNIRRGHPFRASQFSGGEGYFNISSASGRDLPPDLLPAVADQTILIYTKIEVLARLGNVPRGFMNRTTWPQASHKKPLIELSRSEWDKNQLVPWVGIDGNSRARWVDIVVNNLDERGHPFHLV